MFLSTIAEKVGSSGASVVVVFVEVIMDAFIMLPVIMKCREDRMKNK